MELVPATEQQKLKVLAIDLVVRAAPLWAVYWTMSPSGGFADRPVGATPTPSFEVLLGHLDRGPTDLELFCAPRSDGSPSFVATFFPNATALWLSYEWCKADPCLLRSLEILRDFLFRDTHHAFANYSMAHVRGEPRLCQFRGNEFLRRFAKKTIVNPCPAPP